VSSRISFRVAGALAGTLLSFSEQPHKSSAATAGTANATDTVINHIGRVHEGAWWGGLSQTQMPYRNACLPLFPGLPPCAPSSLSTILICHVPSRNQQIRIVTDGPAVPADLQDGFLIGIGVELQGQR
jgi:hypothetical protein